MHGVHAFAQVMTTEECAQFGKEGREIESYDDDDDDDNNGVCMSCVCV